MHSHHHWHFGRGGHHGHGGPFGGRHGFMGRFGGFMGGGGLRAARMLASGDLQLIVLALLAEKPRHGYEIIKALEEHSSGVYTPSPGVVYPALTYLEEMGYAVSEAEGNKKLYKITETGTAHLEKNRALVDETMEQLARFGRKVARMQRNFAEEEAEDDLDSHETGSSRHESRDEWRQLKMEFRALKDELKAALHEKRDATIEEKKRIFAVIRKAIDEIRGRE